MESPVLGIIPSLTPLRGLSLMLRPDTKGIPPLLVTIIAKVSLLCRRSSFFDSEAYSASRNLIEHDL